MFWFGLRWQLRPNVSTPTLGDAIGGLAFDLSRFPASRSDAPRVRKAQVTFMQKHVDPRLDAAAWVAARDKDWAAHCAELTHTHRAQIDNVFGHIVHVASRL